MTAACGLLAPGALAAQESVFASGFGSASGIAVDAAGNVYVADYQRGQIRKLDSAGNPIATWGSPGTGDGELTNPYGLAVSQETGDVYVSDWNRVQEFTSSGVFVRKWGSFGLACTGDTFEGSGGITVDGEGNVWTASESRCVQKFSATGEPLIHWGASGTGPGEFAGPHGIVVDGSGDVYVADLLHRVQRFDPSGSFVLQWGNDSLNTVALPDLAAGPSGSIYVGYNSGAQPGHALERRTPNGSLLGSYGVFQTGGNTSIAVAPGGILYVSDGPRVVAVDPSEPVASIADSAGGSFILTGAAIALDASRSTVPFDRPIDYSWDLGTGSFSLDTGAVDHTSTSFATAGVKTVGVRVTASSGKTATSTRQVDVRPAPPPGRVGVTIDDGDFATNSARVRVEPVWFPGATAALLSNDGGFRPKGTAERQLSQRIPWAVASAGAERLPKTVYVRFLGIGQDATTFSDDIVLDRTTPQIEEASEQVRSATGSSSLATVSARRTRRISLVAEAKISGVSAVTFSSRRRGGRTIKLTNPRQRGIRNLRRTFTLRAKSAPRFVRVRNAAGTWSKWRKIVRR